MFSHMAGWLDGQVNRPRNKWWTEWQTPNRWTTDKRQAQGWQTGTSFLLNSTTALAVSKPPRKVGAESSSSYTVTGKGTITTSSLRAPTRTVHAATSSYFSRSSRSKAQRVLTSRLSGAQRKGRFSPTHQADQEPQHDSRAREQGELSFSGARQEWLQQRVASVRQSCGACWPCLSSSSSAPDWRGRAHSSKPWFAVMTMH